MRKEDCVEIFAGVRSGKWNDRPCTERLPFVCQTNAKITCSPLPSITNGRQRGGTHYGDTVTITCNEGFITLSGTKQQQITCQANGTWSGETPICTKVICGSPGDILHGQRNGSNYAFNDTVRYKCDRGYGISAGDSIRVCQEDGTWSGRQPVCTEGRCNDPGDVENARRTGDNAYDSTMVYTCLPGYFRSAGGHHLTCHPNGSWAGQKPTCSRLNCGDPGEVEGALRTGTFLYGDTVTYSCKTGYVLTAGNTTLRCGADLSWIGNKPLCQEDKIVTMMTLSRKSQEGRNFQSWHIILILLTVLIAISTTVACLVYQKKKRNMKMHSILMAPAAREAGTCAAVYSCHYTSRDEQIQHARLPPPPLPVTNPKYMDMCDKGACPKGASNIVDKPEACENIYEMPTCSRHSVQSDYLVPRSTEDDYYSTIPECAQNSSYNNIGECGEKQAERTYCNS